ncbi:MAG: hypothetical protein ACOH2M_00290 [Cypionkella sp.]
MFWDFIAMIAAGAGLAGILLLVRKVSRGRLPSWSIPAAIGAGMLTFSIWNEYTWYPRAAGALPASVTILSAPEASNIWRPWTYLFPIHTRFAAYDGTKAKISQIDPAFRQGEVAIVQRWTSTRRIPIAVDCAKGLRADLVEGAALAPDGTLTGAEWYPASADDPLQAAACKDS